MRFGLFLAALFIVLLSGCEERPKKQCADEVKKSVVKPTTAELQERLSELERQYDEAGSVTWCERYIVKVINEGSDVLGMPSGSMAAGYADKADALKIASYVVTLSGKSPTHPEYTEEGNLYYNGNCGGCHGDDGKGLGGAFPDLTLPMLKGASLRKERLGREIKALRASMQEQR